MKRTEHAVTVARALLDSDGPMWGYDLVRRTGVPSGRLYPLLKQMMAWGWVVPDQRPEQEEQGYRPPRRYFRVSAVGAAALRELVS